MSAGQSQNAVDQVPIVRPALRLAAVMLLAGQVLYIVVTQFHAGGDANDHPAIFTAYANSAMWTGVHIAQFVSMAILLLGLLALLFALDPRTALGRWGGRFGAALAVVALALYGVLQAIDGVGNKMVDQAWVNAASTEKAARFASAEAMRWLEWGARSYQSFALGLALLLFAAALLRTAWVPGVIPYLMGLSGIAYLAQGWVVGVNGFSSTNTIFILAAWILSVVWMIWLLIAAWRMKVPAAARVSARRRPLLR